MAIFYEPVAEGLKVPGVIVAIVVGVLHLYFFALEAFMWRGRARAVFGMKKEISDATGTLAANQGYYNLLLALGLFVGVGIGSPHVKATMLGAVAGAGLIGGLTAGKMILFIQFAPAFLGFIFAVCGQMDGADAGIAFALEGALLVGTFFVGMVIKKREDGFKDAARASLASDPGAGTTYTGSTAS